MRTIIILSNLSLLLLSCQPEVEYSVEDEIMNCFIRQYEEYGVDVSKSIDSANSALVNYKVLPDISGSSFISMLTQIRDSNGLPFEPSEDLIASLESIQLLPSGLNCVDSSYISFDSTDFYNSKLSGFITIFDALAQSGDVSVESIANDILNMFDEEDFDHPLYSTIGTLALSNLIKVQGDSRALRLLPPPTGGFNDVPKVTLELKLTKDDDLLIDDVSHDPQQVSEMVLEFIRKNELSGLIKINVERNASFELYTQLLDDVNLAYERFYDSKSRELYEDSYESLTPEQQSEIRKQFPKLISLSEEDL